LDTVQFGSVGHLVQISSTYLLTRGENYINTVRFLTQTAPFVS